jgi:hypothetical protein
MTNYGWIWQKMPRLLGQTGETYRGTLNAVGMTPAALFARECIQNAADSALLARKLEIAPEGSTLKLEFHFLTLEGEARDKFVKASKSEQLAKRKADLEIDSKCYLNDLNGHAPLTLLIVRDYNTTGLFGNPLSGAINSHLAKLLFALGDRSKTRELFDAGGSYGFGKGALSKISRAYNVIAYSRFDERPDNGISARLLGCGYYPHHNIDSIDYAGLAYFGVPAKHDPYDLDAALENQFAHELADALSIGSRREGETGTSLLIPDPIINPTELAREIENWWFPALIFNDYEISVFDNDQRIPITPGSRVKRPDLYPFIKAYRLAIGTDKPVGLSEKKYDFEQVDQKRTGTLGMVLVDVPEAGSADQEDESTHTKVALIRSNKMVIKYMFVTDSQPVACGAYVAPDEINELLKIAEPPAHNEWDEDANKLERMFGDTGRKVVQSVKARVKANANHFRRNAIPKKKPSDNHLKVFDAVLSRLFRNRGQGPSLPPANVKSKFSLQFIDGPTLNANEDSSRIFFDAKIKIELMPDVSESTEFKFVPKCQIAEDEGSGEDLYLEIEASQGVLEKLDGGDFKGSLKPGEKLILEVVSEEYAPEWTVNFVPTIVEEA